MPRSSSSPALEHVPDDVRSLARPVDLVALAIVPVVVLGVYLLPGGIRERLAFAYADPTLSAAYLSHFLHLDPLHLLGNLVGFVVVLTLIYVCCLVSRRRREFYLLFATLLFVFPFALSALNALPVRPGVGYGLSGIVLAGCGFLPIALVWFLRARLGLHLSFAHMLAGFAFGLGVIVVGSVPGATVLHAVAVVTIGAGCLLVLGAAGSRPRERIALHAGQIGALEIPTLVAFVYVVVLVGAFPAELAWNGATINVYLHLLGFVFGFVVPFVGFTLLELVEPPADRAPTRPATRGSAEPRCSRRSPSPVSAD